MENTKKPAFNAFDALVIILVIAVAATGFWFFGRDNAGKTTSQVTVEYNVEFSNIAFDSKDDAKVGDLVKDGIEKHIVGTVSSVKSEPQTKITYDYTDINNPKAVKTVVPGLFKVTLTVKAEATQNDAAFTVNNVDIKAGKSMTLQCTNFAGEGFCTSIEGKNNG